MSEFANMLNRLSTVTESENQGRVFTTTGSKLLDFYSTLGSMRQRSESDIIEKYLMARADNKELADNCILYARDIRNGGLGERRMGRILLRELGQMNPIKVSKNLDKIVSCGRWDDLWVLFGTPVEVDVIEYVANQFRTDVAAMKAGKSISLMSKWLPSINTSSAETRARARMLCKELGLTEKTYRKTLAALRKYSNVVERTMSDRNWNEINFESVPSVAMSRYISTFDRHLPSEFMEYKAALSKGEAAVKAATLYPYDITQKFFKSGHECWGHFEGGKLDPVDEAQWNALPNYIDAGYDVLILADVSGSMYVNNCQPLATSIGLATYFAQRNKGAYHGMYITFTKEPHVIKISDEWSLEETLTYVANTDMGYNTNLDGAFKAIYDIAAEVHEVPKALVVISDMEIDSWYGGNFCDSIVSKWKKEYAKIGLEAPKLILWNVESRGDRSIAQQTDNVGYCSGFGVGPFKNLTELITMSAWDSMVKILTQPQFCWQ